MKNPAIVLCAYSIPHPSEFKLNLRIQTDGTITAMDAFKTGLDQLVLLFDSILTKFKSAIHEKDYIMLDGADPDAEM